MRISVVIPMYGKEEYTRKCIDKVIENSGYNYMTVPIEQFYGRPEIDIYVVDDGSPEPFKTDGNYKWCSIRHDKNMGFTAATNTGILRALDIQCYNAPKYILCLNNDTEPEPNFLKELVDVMEADTTIGIAGSVRRHPLKEGEPIELCGSDLIRGYQYFTEEAKLPEDPIPCNWFPICSGLLRVDMIREIGLLDKRMRNHCSDTDYCFRAKFAGWKVMLVPKSIVLHHLSVTTSANNVLVDDDQRIMLEKLAGLDQAKLMSAMPLDGEAKTWGKLEFSVYTK